MRNIQKLIVFTLLIVAFSCSNDDVLQDINNETTTLNKGNGGNTNNAQNVPQQYSNDELIIQYFPGTSNTVKATLRQYHGVVSYDLCKYCPDETIEKWNFGGPIMIEPKRGVIMTPPSGSPTGGGSNPIKNVDYQFELQLNNSATVMLNSAVYESIVDSSYVKLVNDGITIAVIDTGIDTSLPVFTEDFLYNAEGIGYEDDMISGWDFVNDDNTPNDDNIGKHGTVVSSIIFDEFRLRSTEPFQIMPIKAFKADGSALYFDVLCASILAFDYADIINMSFGWQGDAFGGIQDTILSALIADHPNVIVVASAGNDTNNNDSDSIEKKHYPSNYPQDNMYAIGATQLVEDEDGDGDGDIIIADYSNHGEISVDFYATGHTEFLSGTGEGTSFAAPVVAAAIAHILTNPTDITLPIMADIVDKLEEIGEDCTELSFDPLRPVKYNTYIAKLE